MSTGKDKCSKGYSCGLGCISKNKTCLIEVVSSKVKGVLKKLKQAIKALKPKKKAKTEKPKAVRKDGESDKDFSVRSFGEEVMGNKFESSAIFDDDGNQLYRNKGTSHSVEVNTAIAEDNTIVHNHPDVKPYSKNYTPKGQSFSPEDVLIASISNAKESIVYSQSGGKFSMKRPEGGWDKRLSDESYVRGVFNDVQALTKSRIYETVKEQQRQGNATKEDVKEATDRYRDTLPRTFMMILSRDNGFEYTEE